MGKGDQESLELVVAGLQKELTKKATFEGAVASLTDMFRDTYEDASAAEKRAMYLASCRAATLLQSRYTSPGFWAAGVRLLEQAEAVVQNPDEKKHLRVCVAKARRFLKEQGEGEELEPHMRAGTSSGYLFEGQLTMGAEPPRPPWLVIQSAADQILHDMSTENGNPPHNIHVNRDNPAQMEEFHRRLESILATTGTDVFARGQFVGLEEAINATLQEIRNRALGPPPASKEEVAKLVIIEVTEEVLARLEEGTECAVCRETLVIGDKMQEMPCKHSFHPDCLKPWLEAHNSCPICRFELKTDDMEYELQKERDREAEEERRGRENALPGGEYMYT
ncbi:unnamed protein product [Calypogeia fissa]